MKYTLATMLGLFLFSIVAVILSIISIAGMVASENMGAPVKENSILKISLDGTLEERGQEMPFALLMGNDMGASGLDEMLIAIDKACKNDNVKGIYIEAGSLAATPAMLQELRQSLVEFKKSGKFIIAYGDTYSQSSYYIASVADRILLNPEGTIDWHGLASEPMFFKDVLAKVGVKMQVFKVGTYKSAVEPYTSTEMSEANREQVTSYLSSIWENMKKDVAASRKIKVEKLNALADSFMAFRPSTELIAAHLADSTTYIDGVRDYLRAKMEVDEDDQLKFVTVSQMANAESLVDKCDNEIAVYYAYGDIVDDRATNPLTMGGGANISAGVVNQDLKALRENEDVKAVVIRVNSGGGSAYASEQIWHEIELLKAVKPVVISMGGMAASGGYYISSGANKIFAEPMTLTGSIGIFGMFPDMSELLTQKVGVKFDVVKTNALSDMGAQGRPLNTEESRLIQATIERGYETFTGRVAMGRKMKVEDVKAIAEGRVWTGEQALKIGLVDKLGNLEDAIQAAAKLAKTEKYNVGRYPAPTPWYEGLLNEKSNNYLESSMRATLGEYYTTFSLVRNVNTLDRIQMRMPFDPNIH